MNCTHCLAELADPESSFCHKCGKPVVALGGSDVQPIPSAKVFPLTWVFWLLLFITFSSWIGFFLPLFAGHEAKRQMVLPVVVWTGSIFAYVWKKKRNQGWHGFALGSLVAIAVMALAGFAVTYLRAEALLHPTEQRVVPENLAPK